MKQVLVLLLFLLASSISKAQINQKNNSPLDEAYNLINGNYYKAGELKYKIEKAYEELSKENSENKTEFEIVDKFIKSIGDYSLRLISLEDFQKFLNEISGGEHEGIGLPELLSVDIDEKTKKLTVISPLQNSPASKAELLPGDIIFEINGKTTNGLTLVDAMNLLRKKAGEKIKLQIKRNKQTLEKEITSAVIKKMDNPVINKKLNDGINYVWIKRFDQGSAEDVKEILSKINPGDSKGIVLDLRNNPGGMVTEALDICSYFIGNQKVINVMKGKDTLNTFYSEGDKIYDGNVTILINYGTASAAELLASALQYYNNSKLIGANSFGKGLLHNFLPLGENYYLSIPVGKLFTLEGTDILQSGLSPDVKFKSNINNEFDEHITEDKIIIKAEEIINGK